MNKSKPALFKLRGGCYGYNFGALHDRFEFLISIALFQLN